MSKRPERDAKRAFNRQMNGIRRALGPALGGKSFLQVAQAICRQQGVREPTTKDAAKRIVLEYWNSGMRTDAVTGANSIEAAPPRERTPPKAFTTKTPDAIFFSSPQWLELRYKALLRHGARCQCCGHTALTSGQPLHVDHVKPRHTHPHLEWDLDNLQVLCYRCNIGKGAWDQTDWRPEKTC